jgi:serine/threonine protein kinase
MDIHSQFNHKNIVQLIDSGENGKIERPNGSTVTGLFYCVMEYIPEGMFFDILNHFNGVGEVVAKYFYK